MEQDLRDECLRADLELLGQRQVRILMLGRTGSGKSSFINSLYCALTDKLKQYTHVEDSDTSSTPFLHNPPLSVGGNVPYFRIQDTPGIMETQDEFYKNYVTLALDGHMKEGVKISPGDIPRELNYYVKEPGVMDRPCLVVFVWGPGPLNTDSNVKGKLEIAKDLARHNKIKLVIVVTMADLLSQYEAHPLKNADVQYIFNSGAVLDAVHIASRNTKLPEGCIFPVTNYTEQTETCTEMNIVLLYTLSKLLDDAKLEADKRLEAERL